MLLSRYWTQLTRYLFLEQFAGLTDEMIVRGMKTCKKNPLLFVTEKKLEIKTEKNSCKIYYLLLCFFFLWRCDQTRVIAFSFFRFLDHTQRRTTVGKTRLDEWSARRRDLYLTTHNTHNRQTSMPSVGFEPTTSAGERAQTYALERAATGTGIFLCLGHK